MSGAPGPMERLPAGQPQMQDILDSLLDPLVILAPVRDDARRLIDCTYRWANKAACQYLAIPRATLLGRRMTELFPSLVGSPQLSALQRVLDGGQPLVRENHLLFNDLVGQPRHYDFRVARVDDGISYTWRDVTARHAAAGKLADSEALLRSILDSMPDVFGLLAPVHDDNGGVTDLEYLDVNEACCRLTGLPREAHIGLRASQVFPGFLASELFAREVEALLTGEQLVLDDYFYPDLKGPGAGAWLSIRAVPVSGKLSVLVRDVSERHAQFAQIIAAREAAESASQAKATFLANMSHEIRTPLNAVLGLLGLLSQSELEPDQAMYVAKSERAASSLLGILNDILDFSKIEAGRLELNPEPFEIDALLRDIGVILAGNLGDKQVDLLMDVDPRTPNQVVGDELRLRQVLLNLAGNAVKFTTSGEVRIATEVMSVSSGEVTLQFTVSDTGIGMAPEALEQVFEGFVQAEASIARRFGGSGLGLAITSRLLELMGSKLDVASELGRGTRFSFQLVLEVPAAALVGVDPDEMPTLRGLNVLIVGERPAANDVLARLCTSLGWEPTTVTDARQASLQLSGASGRSLDLMIIDSVGPSERGWDLIDQIAATGSPRPTTLQLTTHPESLLACATPADLALVDRLIPKPVTASVIYDQVAELRLGGPLPPVPVDRRQELLGLDVLLVEDNEVNREIAEELLVRQGARVTTAVNGLEALELVAANPKRFQVVLMDMQMPVMDGLQATVRIRELPLGANVPIIAMTANAMESDRQLCLAAGCDDHIGKPFVMAELIVRIRNVGAVLDPAEVRGPAAVATPEGPMLLDAGTGLARVGDDREFYDEMLVEFDSWLREVTTELAGADPAGPRTELTRAAHSIKGTAATLGADALSATAMRLEAAAKDPDSEPGEVRALIGATLAAVEQTRVAIVDWLA